MQTYVDYATNAKHMQEYTEYQKRYRKQLRESDTVLIDLVRRIRDDQYQESSSVSILDIGCSTGNLLLHLKRLIPGLSLFGGDMAGRVVDDCRQNAELKGIQFAVMDATCLDQRAQFDFVVANAILGVVDEEQFDKAIRSISDSLRDDGWLLVFDWFHPFAQELTITECSDSIPTGLTWRSRSYERMQAILSQSGFAKPQFKPFYIPIDLERSDDPRSVQSHSVTLKNGRRLSFRGAICQPWCHMIVQNSV